MAVLFPAAGRAQVLNPDTGIAQRHFRTGMDHYERQEYEPALQEFRAARLVRPHPAMDFNIARCLNRLERFDEAAEAYERYLASSPTPTDAAEIKARITVLKERARATAPPPPAPTTVKTLGPTPAGPLSLTATPEQPARSSVVKKWWFWTALAGGAAVIAIAIAVPLSTSGYRAESPFLGTLQPGAVKANF